MANKFTRNVTGTNLGGNKLNPNDKAVEPFMTNVQNDLLSDDTDVYVRQAKNENPESEDKYFCLTDGVKEIKSSHVSIGIEQNNKNTTTIRPFISNKKQAEEGQGVSNLMTPLRTKEAIDFQVPDLVKEHETPTEIVSKSDELTVTKTSKNNFELEVEFPEQSTINLSKLSIPSVKTDGLVTYKEDEPNILFLASKMDREDSEELQTKVAYVSLVNIPNYSFKDITFYNNTGSDITFILSGANINSLTISSDKSRTYRVITFGDSTKTTYMSLLSN